MRRADRLFLIIHALRGRRVALPAHALAQTLGVEPPAGYAIAEIPIDYAGYRELSA